MRREGSRRLAANNPDHASRDIAECVLPAATLTAYRTPLTRVRRACAGRGTLKAKRTVKFFAAILKGDWIVSTDWVVESVRRTPHIHSTTAPVLTLVRAAASGGFLWRGLGTGGSVRA